MKLKSILAQICLLLGGSIITLPMIETNQDLINYNADNKTNLSNNLVNDSYTVDPQYVTIDVPQVPYFVIPAHYSGLIERCSATVRPSDASQGVNWSIENSDAPDGAITIDNIGKLSIEDFISGPISNSNFMIGFDLVCTSIAKPDVFVKKRISIFYDLEKPKLGDLNLNQISDTASLNNNFINLSYGDTGIFDLDCEVLNINNTYADLIKEYELIDPPSGVTINNNQLTITNSNLGDNQEIKINCNVYSSEYPAAASEKQYTFYLNTNYALPELSSISLSGTGVNDSNINLTYHQAATISASCSITNETWVDPTILRHWSILNNPNQGISINQNSGEIQFSDNLPIMNNQNLTIVYEVGTGLNLVRQTLRANLTISYADPILGDISLTKNSGDAIISERTISQTYGTTSTFNAACNINNNTNIDPNSPKTWSINNAPSGVSIDGISGMLTINNPNLASNQIINITYTVGMIKLSQTYTLNVDYVSPIILSDIVLTKNYGDAILSGNSINQSCGTISIFSASCSITNEANIDPNLSKTWSINNVPSGVSIDAITGLITIANPSYGNNQTIDITYNVGTVSKNTTYMLNVDYASPILGDITLNGNGVLDDHSIDLGWNEASQIFCNCSINNKEYLDPSLTGQWSLKNQPSGVSINSDNGTIDILSNLARGNYQFSIVYRYGTIIKESVVNLEIGYEVPRLSIITLTNPENLIIDDYKISVNYKQEASFKASCQITNIDNVDPNLSLSLHWSLQNAPSGVSIDENSGLVKIASTIDPIKDWECQIVCHVNDKITRTFDFNLSVINQGQSIVSNPIFWAVLIPFLVIILIILLVVFFDYKRKHSKN